MLEKNYSYNCILTWNNHKLVRVTVLPKEHKQLYESQDYCPCCRNNKADIARRVISSRALDKMGITGRTSDRARKEFVLSITYIGQISQQENPYSSS